MGWKTPEQAVAVSLAVENVRDFIAVLPTGSGKSAIFMAAALSRSQGVVVVVVPLRMLLYKQKQACKAGKVPCCEYSAGGQRVGHAFSGLVFVSAETAGSEEFLAWARTSISMGSLHCIVIDEVHLVLGDFRPRMTKNLVRLSGLSCQMIGLTASLRPGEEPELRRRLAKMEIGVIRSSTVRPNLVYAATNVSNTAEYAAAVNMMDDVIAARLLDAWWMAEDFGIGGAKEANVVVNGTGRAMVYCLTVKEAQYTGRRLAELAEAQGRELNAAVLYSGMEEEAYKRELQLWENGGKPVLVATGVIGCGYDYPHVRMVLHRGMVFSLADYHQQSGRCGRDGLQGRCEVVYSPVYHSANLADLTRGDEPFLNERDAGETRAANEWIQNSKVCRRWGLHKEMDGVAQRCCLVPGGLLCDLCSGESEVTFAPPWELMRPRRYEDLEAADVEAGEWIMYRQPSVTPLDAAYWRDVGSFDFLRSYAMKFMAANSETVNAVLCSLCSNPGGLPERATRHAKRGLCPAIQGRCFRCLSRDHSAKGCPSRAQEVRHCCHKCYFPMGFANDICLHRGMEGRNECTEGDVGDAILTVIWFCYRNEELRRKLRGPFGFVGLPEEANRLENYLTGNLVNTFFNNFIRVGAACIRAYGEWSPGQQRPTTRAGRPT
jgi:superfamily II DNA or RNA helicase